MILITVILMLPLSAYADTNTADDFDELALYSDTDLQQAEKAASFAKARMDIAHNIAENTRALGYNEDHPVVIFAQEEWISANTAYEENNKILANSKWSRWGRQYPAATIVWKRLTVDYGLSAPVTAGILGNMMTECGGQTLNLDYTVYGNGFYGMCQWNMGFSNVWGTDLQTQINFLMETIKYEMDTFGSNYYNGFNYEAFKALQNEQDAALAFAKCYERCGSGSYYVRQTNATKALNFFI